MSLLITLGLKPKKTLPGVAGAVAESGDDAPAPARAAGGGSADKAKNPSRQDRDKRELSDLRADIDAIVAQITALVLGGIADDAGRKRVNEDLGKLKAVLAKAGKIADPKAATKAFGAALGPAQALLARAQGTKEAVDVVQAKLTPLLVPARAGLAALAAPTRAVLQAELDALQADIRRYVEAGDATALQAIVAPRLAKLHKLATGLPKVSAQADAELARAAKLVQALDAARSADLQARLADLQAKKQAGWPAGKTLDEIAAAVDGVSAGVKTLIEDAEAVKNRLAIADEIAKLRKRVDALKPRTDKASAAPVPRFIDNWQQRVRSALADFAKYEAANNLKSCEVMFSQLGAALDSLEQAKTRYAAHRAKFVAARDGTIKAALAVKLQPATLAALRTKSINAKGSEIEALAEGGQIGKADQAVDAWQKAAKTWGESQATYNNLRSGHPKVGAMKDLIGQPGGGEVFDAIVADLPEDTQAVNVNAAIEARFDITVKQFNHRDQPKDADGNPYPDKSKALNPKAPQKGLKDLYRVLRMVPVKDVKYTEKIVDYQEQGRGAYFQPGVFNDEIVMYAGRPDDASNTTTLGGVVAPEDQARVAPENQPQGGDQVNWYSYAALHEVAHGLDDARKVMKPMMGEAGWESHGTGAIAKKVAAFFSYDADYIESMMDSGNNTPPKKRPKRPPEVKTDAEWESNRRDAERWVTESRETFNPWDKGDAAKRNAIGGRVYQEAYAGDWVSYHLAARATGIRGYQFRSSAEWFAELYAAFHIGKLSPKHKYAAWLQRLKVESESAS